MSRLTIAAEKARKVHHHQYVEDPPEKVSKRHQQVLLPLRPPGSKSNVPPPAKNCPLAVHTLSENSFSMKAARLWNLFQKAINTI